MSQIPGLKIDPIASDDFQNGFEAFRKQLASLYGPRGRLKIFVVQDECETSSSFSDNLVAILKNHNTKNPFISIILNAGKNQSNSYGDGGKFVCLFITLLVQRLSQLTFNKYLVTKMFEYFSTRVMDVIRRPDSIGPRTTDFENARKVLDVVRTVIESKPGCNHGRGDSEHLSFLLLRGFLNCLPALESETPVCIMGALHFITLEGCTPRNSILTEGVPVPCQDIESIRKILSKPDSKLHDFTVLLLDFCLDGTVAFSGGSVNLAYRLKSKDVIFDELKRFAQKVVENVAKPTILASQKVIHPALIQYLFKNDIIVLDRLGTEMSEILKQLTGALSLITLEMTEDYSKCQGKVAQIEIVEYGGKEFVQLHNPQSSIHTILLCNLTKESLSETKLVCKQAVRALQGLVKSRKSIFGGGCAETVLVAELENWIKGDLGGHTERLKCSKEHLISFCDAFCSTLTELATYPSHKPKSQMLRDDIYNHLWEEPSCSDRCLCRMIKRDDSLIDRFTYLTTPPTNYFGSTSLKIKKPFPVQSNNKLVLDEFSCRISAWQIALETASLLLSTGLYIKRK